MHKALAALALWSVATAAAAQADGYTKLSGSLTITSKNWTDPPPGEKKDRVGLILEGAAAKRVYNAMSGKASQACEDPTMRHKVAGNLECLSYKDGTYMCMVAIMLTNGQSRPFGEC